MTAVNWDAITERQIEYLRTLCRQCHLAEATMLHEINQIRRPSQQAATSFEALTKQQAGWAIDRLCAVRDGKMPAPTPPGQRSYFGSAS